MTHFKLNFYAEIYFDQWLKQIIKCITVAALVEFCIIF